VLELDGETAGWLTSASGGLAVGIVAESDAGSAIPNKQITGAVYEELALVAPAGGMSKSFYAWLRAVADRDAPGARRSGAVVVTDAAGHEARRLAFTNVLLTEVALPSADARSKETATLSLRLRPESARVVFPGAGKVIITPAGKPKKLWTAANFRLTLGDLPTKRVTKVELPKLTAKIAAADAGESGRAAESVRFDVSAFDLEVGASDAPDWYDWYDDFVVRGRNGQDAELDGALEFLSADGKTTVLRVTLHGVGVTAMAFLDGTSGDAPPAARVSMYCEDADLGGAVFD
jgi:hypothetical protein